MVQNIVNSKDFLKLLAKAGKKKRKSLLKKATHKEIQSLYEIALNVKNNTVRLKPCVARKIVRGRYRPYIRAAADKKNNLEARRKIFLQHGGFLQLIIPAALLYLKEFL